MRAAALACLALSACNSIKAVPGTQVRTEYGNRQALFDAPFPSEEFRKPGRPLDLSLFRNPNNVDLINRAVALLEAGPNGFGTTSGIFLQFDGALDPASLPSIDASVAESASVFLIGIDPASPDYLKRLPVMVGFSPQGTPFGANNLLSIVPVQGFPMRPGTAYAAVVRRSLNDAKGKPLGVSLRMSQLIHAQQPAGIPDAAWAVYDRAVQAVASLHVAQSDVAAITAFTTADPTADLPLVRDDALTRPAPLPQTPLALQKVYTDFCLYKSTVQMPDYQSGTPPYMPTGGRWLFDPVGRPIFQRYESANLFVTIPRRPQPADGWPAVLYIRAGGGGDAPMVDRGPQTSANGPAAPGEGPAMHFAQVGWAGVQVDGPLGGSRNPNGADEEFLVFNFLNPDALRDNIRESAMETSLTARALEKLTVDASGCDPQTQGTQSFDLKHLALFGHSTGATIAPIAAAIEPRIGAMIMSGAGASYLNNVLYKQKPLDVLPLAETLLGYTSMALDARDPVLSIIQWAAEPADGQVYARALVKEPPSGSRPKQILMFQGIVDHYIMPPMANALSLTIGVDLAGPALDETSAELAPLPHIRPLLPLGGRAQIDLPAVHNFANTGDTKTTAVLVQELGDGIDDGHEVVFQTEPPKHQYRCYLQSWASGAAKVPKAGAALDPCP